MSGAASDEPDGRSRPVGDDAAGTTRRRRPASGPVGDRIRAGLRAVAEFHEAWFTARWRSTLRREARDQQDTMRALMLLDTLGVDSPVAYETLELVPFLLADMHEWHVRMGRDEYDGPGGCC